jgi:hypothetical protein
VEGEVALDAGVVEVVVGEAAGGAAEEVLEDAPPVEVALPAGDALPGADAAWLAPAPPPFFALLPQPASSAAAASSANDGLILASIDSPGT